MQGKKKIVGGRIDLGVGTPTNGNKPSILIEGREERLSIYLGCLAEAKAADVSVATKK